MLDRTTRLKLDEIKWNEMTAKMSNELETNEETNMNWVDITISGNERNKTQKQQQLNLKKKNLLQ